MAEGKDVPREVSLSQRLPWVTIFQGFRIALDFNKLLLAAGGILVMAFGWWLLAAIFDYGEPDKDLDKRYSTMVGGAPEKWKAFKNDHDRWALRHQLAGSYSKDMTINAADLANSEAEYTALQEVVPPQSSKQAPPPVTPEKLKKYQKDFDGFDVKVEVLRSRVPRPAGSLRGWPWFEDRGPNPYLLATGQTKGWQKGQFWDWLLRVQVPVLLEPVVKLIRPVIYFFSPNVGAVTSFYCLLVLLWTVVTWAIFGGAICRIAAVQIARQEKITLGEAVRFTAKRWVSLVTAPLFPLLCVGFCLVVLVIFGFVQMIPYFGELVDGIFWFITLIFGLLMAIGLIGLIGWPLMSATISTEGTDSWEAVSRSYSYVFQAPWYYIWCTVLALAYGAVVMFFVGFMGSFAVYLSKWGVSQTPWIKAANREPAYLFVYSPTSFGWRELLLKGVELNNGEKVVNPDGTINEVVYERYLGNDDNYEKNRPTDQPRDTLTGMNKFGAILVSFWIYGFFLLILGFSYSFFWSVSAIIYLLMRKKVDDAEMDEVYLEEDTEDYQGPLTPPAPAATPAPAGTMVEAPTLRTPPAAIPPPPPLTPPAPPPPAPAAPEPPPSTELVKTPEPPKTTEEPPVKDSEDGKSPEA
jgi:hypothetical protein